MRYPDPDEPDRLWEETLMQSPPEIWVEKNEEPSGNRVGVAESLLEKKCGYSVYSPKRFKERRKHPRFQIVLPLEFEEIHGAVVCNLSEGGLLIHSVQDMLVSRELKVKVFFAEEYELDQFKATARIAWKGYHSETDWEGFKYALEFVEISAEDRQKLVNLLEETP